MKRPALLALVSVLALSAFEAQSALAGPDDGSEGASRKRMPTVADGMLKQGSYRQAVEAYKLEIAKNAESVPSHLGLGRALTRLGRCDVAMEEFWPYVGMKAFSSDVALAAAVCAGRLGFGEDALMFSQMAVDRNPNNAPAMTNLALTLDTAGRYEELDALLAELSTVRDDRDASYYARTVLALRSGDITEFDIIADAWPTTGETVMTLAALRGQSWLDLDDPIQTGRVMRKIKRLRRPGLARMVSTEGVRREGEFAQAKDMLEDRNLRTNDSSDSDAIRVRVLADQGDFTAAHAILDGYEVGIDADLVASAWYLAWHERDVPQMRSMRDLYLTVRVSPLRNLYKLIPIIWRLDYIPGDPMPAPPDPAVLRKAAADAAKAAAERWGDRPRPGMGGPAFGDAARRRGAANKPAGK
jgi:tetratricopeptide (TPR) repeat protein